MDAVQSRRTLVKLVAGAGVAMAAGAMPRPAMGQGPLASGGIGLLRNEWELVYGAGNALQSLVEYPNVSIGVPGAKAYAGYRGDLLVHLEVRWSQATQAGGVDWGTAYQAALLLMPADTEYRDQFWMPATPEGPVEIIGHTYESPDLNAAYYNLGRMLVLFQRVESQQNAGSMAETIGPAVTITLAEVGQ